MVVEVCVDGRLRGHDVGFGICTVDTDAQL
jgi:hypothetical protein